MQKSEIYRLCHGFCLFERAARLFPLLQSVIHPPQGGEKALEDLYRRKGPRKRDGVLHEPKGLFISPRIQQSMREANRTDDLYRVILDVL